MYFDFIEVAHKMNKSMQILTLGIKIIMAKNWPKVKKIKCKNIEILDFGDSNNDDVNGDTSDDHAAP